jgi:uncharacterized LabA/DUF88 family protein
MSKRAIIFIDGNNWYHSLRALGLRNLEQLHYGKISQKLAGPARSWVATRYYIGQVNQAEVPAQYAAQRRFLARLVATDPRISHHLGRLESRIINNELADMFLAKLNDLPVRIDIGVYRELIALATKHRSVTVKVEKAVDVQIAVDMVTMALRDAYDVAYLLSADGDLTPAVREVRATGRKVFIATPNSASQLAQSATALIRPTRLWFDGCWQ